MRTQNNKDLKIAITVLLLLALLSIKVACADSLSLRIVGVTSHATRSAAL